MKYQLGKVYKTKSGIFIRVDDGVGLLAYSPYTGLMFVVHPEDIDDAIAWMNLEQETSAGETIHCALGVGWDNSVGQGRFPMPHYLASRGTWDRWPWPQHSPILINWFLTGDCPLRCMYCDAEDLMRHTRPEPSSASMRRIASKILSYNPLAVVLTGGEPLLSPYLDECISLLHDRTGIIVDTNGMLLTRRTARLFREKRVVARISMDSPIPRYNDYQRCLPSHGRNRKASSKHSSGPLNRAVEALSLCLDEGVSVCVQTVATRKTINDLPALGDRLYVLGLKSWRIHLVAIGESNPHRRNLFVAFGVKKNALEELSKRRRKWNSMDLQIVDDVSRNSVVIVSPDGEFLTESNTGAGKIPIDAERPSHPRIGEIFASVAPESHAKRYLGDPDIPLGRWLNE